MHNKNYLDNVPSLFELFDFSDLKEAKEKTLEGEEERLLKQKLLAYAHAEGATNVKQKNVKMTIKLDQKFFELGYVN